MKPMQRYQDSRITNISLENFTGSIRFITSLSDDETKELMLSSPPQTNAGSHLLNSNHHLTLITQPILTARSTKLDQHDLITNTRRNSLDHSPLLLVPIQRSQCEKKNTQHESIDSGIDLSPSTNSSVQYPQHRPLSALNENGNTNVGSHDQSIRNPISHLGRKRSTENMIGNHPHEQQHHSSSCTNEREKISTDAHSDVLKEHLHSSTHPHRSLNDLTNKILPSRYTMTRKSTRKKAKLNSILEPSQPLASPRLTINDEPIHSVTRTTSSSSNQTIINQQTKLKATIPMIHYPNQEQIRAHINRSVVDRQHPSYLPIPPRRGVVQQIVPLDVTSSKVNHRLSRQQNAFTPVFHPSTHVQGGGSHVSTVLNLHVPLSRPTKQTFPVLHHPEIIDDRQEKRNQKEKRRPEDTNKDHKSSPREQVQLKIKETPDSSVLQRKRQSSQAHLGQTIDQHHLISSTQDQQVKERPFHTNKKKRTDENQLEHFLTSTPRRHCEFDNDYANNRPQQQFTDLIQKSKLTNGHFSRTKNRALHPHSELQADCIRRNSNTPFQTQQNLTPKIEQNHQLHRREKSSDSSINYLLRTTQIQPTHSKNHRQDEEINRINNTSKTNFTQLNKIQKKSNRSMQITSPIVRSIISDRERYDSYESSSSSPRHDQIENQPNLTYRLVINNEQQPLQRRHIIPTDNSQFPLLTDPPSQTSSHHTYPFTCTMESNNPNDVIANHSPRELPVSNKIENLVDQRSSTSSSWKCVVADHQHSLPLEKTIILPMEVDGKSTNYDSDDGWSNDSAEVIYTDERYKRQNKKKKKKIIASSSSLNLISQQNSHLPTQQQNILLQ